MVVLVVCGCVGCVWLCVDSLCLCPVPVNFAFGNGIRSRWLLIWSFVCYLVSSGLNWQIMYVYIIYMLIHFLFLLHHINWSIKIIQNVVYIHKIINI